MRKLLLTCRCGQQMRVPRSAMGRTGLCPNCGATIRIGASNTTLAPLEDPSPQPAGGGPRHATRGAALEEAKRTFARGADLYFTGHHAEALAYFTELAAQFPSNQHVATARELCLEALECARESPTKEPWQEQGRAALPDKRNEERWADGHRSSQFRLGALARAILRVARNGRAFAAAHAGKKAWGVRTAPQD